ncbi:MAG: hypothetical protein ACI4Q3_07870 [Kiritimatiellia bacterium]
MAGVSRFLLALACLPLCVALPRVLYLVVFSGQGVFAGTGVPEGGFWLAGGFLAFFPLAACLPFVARAYVLGHELTHAVWALGFGAKVSGLKVGAGGGELAVSKSNVWITLAPYFFPFYTFALILAAGVVRLFVAPLPCPNAWLFAIGLTWAFHAAFTVRALSREQPDVAEYGRLFSWSFIWIANCAGLLLGLVVLSPLTLRSLGDLLWRTAVVCYASVGRIAIWLVEALRGAAA